MEHSTPTPPPSQPAEPTPVQRDINLEAAAAVAALGAIPIIILIAPDGTQLDAGKNLLPFGWRLAVGYVERPK